MLLLKKEGIGAGHTCGPGLTDLDELFVAHGFFADLDFGDVDVFAS